MGKKLLLAFFLFSATLVIGKNSILSPKVAIFSQPLFPRFGANPNFHPQSIAQYLSRFGIASDLIDAPALASPSQFNASKYSILVYPYGNTFPLDAVDNIRAFHAQGGCIIAVSVPFCHPCEGKGAKGWQFHLREGDSAQRIRQGFKGRYSLFFRKDSQGWSIISSAPIPKDADTYVLSAWIKNLGGEGTPPSVTSPSRSSKVTGIRKENERIFLRFWSEEGQFLGQEGPSLSQGKEGEWQFVSQEIRVPEGAKRLDVILAVYEEKRELLVDEIFLTVKGSSDDNLLINGGFEEGDAPWEDLGHTDAFLSHQGIGMGGFYTPKGEVSLVYKRENDILGLDFLNWQVYEGIKSQALDVGSLSEGDEEIPIVGYYESVARAMVGQPSRPSKGDQEGEFHPVIAIVRHKCPQFKGAIDVWLGQVFSNVGFANACDTNLLLDLRQAYLASVLYILQEKGLISPRRREEILLLSKREYERDYRRKTIANIARYPSVFPHSAPPQGKMFVCDLRQLSEEERFPIVSLQGLVNRTSPSLYLVLNPVDENWLNWMKERGDIKEVERVGDPYELFRIYKNRVKGIIIYDPEVPASVNVATMLASLKESIIASPRVASSIPLPVLSDLRKKWRTNAEAYRWALDNLWGKLNHQFLVSLPPHWAIMRDYAIEFKAFTFWVTGELDAFPSATHPSRPLKEGEKKGLPPAGDPLEERLVIEDLLRVAPANIGILGVPYAGEGIGLQEGPGVALWSSYGKFLAWSHIPNLSVHSGTRRVQFKQKTTSPPPLEERIYISLLVSDGDAPVNWYDFFFNRYWGDPKKSFPLNWSVGPAVYDLIPDIMDYYYSRATPNDYFLCAFGVGYAFLDFYGYMYKNKYEVLKGFIDLTREYMEKMGLTSLWSHHEGEDYLAMLARRIDLECILADYGRFGARSYADSHLLLSGKTPVFHALTSFDPKGGEKRNFSLVLEDARRFTPQKRPAFMHIFIQCYPFSPTLLKELLGDLGGEYVPVRADQLAELYKKGSPRLP